MVDAPLAIRSVIVPPRGLPGDLRIPPEPEALIVFAHGSGSSRFSARNIEVAQALARARLATLLFDLLTDAEAEDRAKVFDVERLAIRLVEAVEWAEADPGLQGLPIGLFGASTGAAAALIAAARLGTRIGAVVSRGGRPDLAAGALTQVRCPTLLIVGGADEGVLQLNEQAYARLAGPKALHVVPGATHLFPERGALSAVARLAADWFHSALRADAEAPS